MLAEKEVEGCAKAGTRLPPCGLGNLDLQLRHWLGRVDVKLSISAGLGSITEEGAEGSQRRYELPCGSVEGLAHELDLRVLQ